ncbi:MAG: type IIA DNA topoisomerase subunit B [Clostridia bacterium]|nr:type IIA DNA topoisomerase subunit B [Clostridia bacterium]
MAEHKSYDAKDIQVLEGLDAVRLRPGMYIGTTGPKGLHHLIWELVDNAIDEAANGYCDRIIVSLNADGSVTVEDNGRGIPVDIHPTLKISAVEVVYTKLHAGGKFNNENYAYSGGLHGVGASVVNALSKWLVVEVCRGGKKYSMRFETITKNGKVHGGVPVAPLTEVGKAIKSGTKVTYLADDTIFETVEYEHETILKKLRELAFLNKGVEIVFIDNRKNIEESQRCVTFKYEGGIVDFVKFMNESKTVLYDKPIYIEGERNGIKVAVAIEHTDSYTDNVFSYVNNIPTTEGGTHEVGLRSALTRVFNDLARKTGALKDKDANYIGDDFKEGLTAVLIVKMKNVQFEGQTKTKLGNPEAKNAVEGVISDGLVEYFSSNKTGKILSQILSKAEGAAKVREAARKAKEITRQKNALDGAPLVGKLASCTGKNVENNELFIVEGNSAGGTAKQARDRFFQAVLPLRGKPLNVEKKRIDQVLQNEEFRTIITALNAGIGEDFNLANLKYHKVIILADADQDGAHIRAILLTFFYRYMRELITEGHVYIGMPPLYKVYKKDVEEYVYSDNELDAAIERVGKGYGIQRYKGLGEMSNDQLWDTTLNPDARSLIRVSIEDAAEAEKMITVLMGDNIDARKAYITENADFNKVDNFKPTAAGK